MKLYEKSGVNIAKADELTQIIKGSNANIGRFGAVCEHRYLKDYYLVTTTDGVGSKITPLIERKLYANAAADLAAMNLNDLACSGAAPVSFVDYISTNKLDTKEISNIVLELKKTLKLHGCELSGGETSELCSIIKEGKIDIAGFAVGLVKKENLLDKKNTKSGDIVIGLTSSGPHSNGFTLINYLYENKKLSEEEFEQALAPTTIYINEILQLADKSRLISAANITGGGIFNNLKRAVRDDLKIEIDYKAIPPQKLFKKLYELCSDEAYEVFNMGVGFCVITAPEHAEEVMSSLDKYTPFILGRLKDE